MDIEAQRLSNRSRTSFGGGMLDMMDGSYGDHSHSYSDRYTTATLETQPMGEGRLIQGNMADINLDGSGYRDRVRGGGDLDGNSSHHSRGYDSSSNNKSQRRLIKLTLIFVGLLAVAAMVAGMRNGGNGKEVAPVPGVEATPAPQVEEEEVISGVALVETEPPSETEAIATPQEDQEEEVVEEEAPTAEEPEEEDDNLEEDTTSELEDVLIDEIEMLEEEEQAVADAMEEAPPEQAAIFQEEINVLESLEHAAALEERAWEKLDEAENEEEMDLLLDEQDELDKEEDNLQSQLDLLEEELDAETTEERSQLEEEVDELKEEEETLALQLQNTVEKLEKLEGVGSGRRLLAWFRSVLGWEDEQ